MLTWLTNNIGTIVVALILFGIVCAIAIKLLRDKKNGKTSCGCNCANCALSGTCNKKN